MTAHTEHFKTKRWAEAAHEFIAADAQYRSAKITRDHAKNEFRESFDARHIKPRQGESAYGIGAGVEVRFTHSHGRTSYDMKRLIEEHLEIDFAEYEKTTKDYFQVVPKVLAEAVVTSAGRERVAEIIEEEKRGAA